MRSSIQGPRAVACPWREYGGYAVLNHRTHATPPLPRLFPFHHFPFSLCQLPGCPGVWCLGLHDRPDIARFLYLVHRPSVALPTLCIHHPRYFDTAIASAICPLGIRRLHDQVCPNLPRVRHIWGASAIRFAPQEHRVSLTEPASLATVAPFPANPLIIAEPPPISHQLRSSSSVCHAACPPRPQSPQPDPKTLLGMAVACATPDGWLAGHPHAGASRNLDKAAVNQSPRRLTGFLWSPSWQASFYLCLPYCRIGACHA